MRRILVALMRRAARRHIGDTVGPWRDGIQSWRMSFEALTHATVRLSEANVRLAEATHRIAACEQAARRLRGSLSYEPRP